MENKQAKIEAVTKFSKREGVTKQAYDKLDKNKRG